MIRRSEVRNWHPARLVLGLGMMLAVLSVWFSAKADPINPSSQQLAARDAFAAEIPNARLLWTRGDDILHTQLEPWSEEVVTQNGKESDPKWSPDGTEILYVRNDTDVWVMNADFSNRRAVLSNGDTADWVRGEHAFTAINTVNRKQILKHDLDTGSTDVIHDESQSPFRGYDLTQAATLRAGGRYLLSFTIDDGHRSFIVDLQNQSYIANNHMDAGDCSPDWAPDGMSVIYTRRLTPRPVYTAPFDPSAGTVGSSSYLVGDGNCHAETFSSDGQYVLYAGDTPGQREIFGWKIGTPRSNGSDGDGVRLTFDSTDDWSPALLVGGAGPSDTTPPTVVSATARGNPNLVRVLFSESLDQSSAEAAGNYAINQSISVTGATLDTDNRTVRLATSTLSEGVTYTLTINNVEDRANNAIAPDTQVDFEYDPTAAPELALSETFLAFTSVDGTSVDPTEMDVEVTNIGTGTLDDVSVDIQYSGTESGWLDVSSSGTGNSQTLTNVPTADGLPDGTHSATVDVVSGNAINTPLQYEVLLHVGGDPSIVVRSPNGGEVWGAGSTQQIEWAAFGIDDVTIHSSCDNGSTWDVVEVTVDNKKPDWQDYAWTVPNTPSDECLIRISDYFGIEAEDDSDAPFSIVRSVPRADGGTSEGGANVPSEDASEGCACSAPGRAPAPAGRTFIVGLILLGAWTFRNGRHDK